ncbi:MAG: hypothetical protein NTW86_03205 [Candidatus Sumerlaeota bacterium]|nr:hypothetical protein [Candidatus Sumerlaeota bacterium]
MEYLDDDHALLCGDGWLMTAMRGIIGGAAYILPVSSNTVTNARHKRLASFKRGQGEAVFLLTSCDADATIHPNETVEFRVPKSLLPTVAAAKYVCLDSSSFFYDILPPGVCAIVAKY